MVLLLLLLFSLPLFFHHSSLSRYPLSSTGMHEKFYKDPARLGPAITFTSTGRSVRTEFCFVCVCCWFGPETSEKKNSMPGASHCIVSPRRFLPFLCVHIQSSPLFCTFVLFLAGLQNADDSDVLSNRLGLGSMGPDLRQKSGCNHQGTFAAAEIIRHYSTEHPQ
jgi:hypothetical protein